DVRVRGIGKSFRYQDKTVDQQLREVKRQSVSDQKAHGKSQVYFEGGRLETPIYKLEDLSVGDEINGPAVLADGTQTIVVTPKAKALILETHVIIDLNESSKDE
ncbi:hypothetical protein PC116_g34929, partial [Phytophthora cactorum]